MLQPKTRPATYADIEALPEHECGEIIHGLLHVHRYPPRISCAVTMLLHTLPAFDAMRGGSHWLLRRPEVHLGQHVIVPDIAGWLHARLPRLPDEHIGIRPDWVAEFLQPDTIQLDRTDKLSVYATFGVGHCWYVDPDARTLEVFALNGAKWQLAATFKDSDAVTAPPFEVHTFPLDVLWMPEPPPA